MAPKFPSSNVTAEVFEVKRLCHCLLHESVAPLNLLGIPDKNYWHTTATTACGNVPTNRTYIGRIYGSKITFLSDRSCAFANPPPYLHKICSFCANAHDFLRFGTFVNAIPAHCHAFLLAPGCFCPFGPLLHCTCACFYEFVHSLLHVTFYPSPGFVHCSEYLRVFVFFPAHMHLLHLRRTFSLLFSRPCCPRLLLPIPTLLTSSHFFGVFTLCCKRTSFSIYACFTFFHCSTFFCVFECYFFCTCALFSRLQVLSAHSHLCFLISPPYLGVLYFFYACALFSSFSHCFTFFCKLAHFLLCSTACSRLFLPICSTASRSFSCVFLCMRTFCFLARFPSCPMPTCTTFFLGICAFL